MGLLSILGAVFLGMFIYNLVAALIVANYIRRQKGSK